MEQIKKQQHRKKDVTINQCALYTGLLLVYSNDLGRTRTPLTVYTDMIPHLEMHWLSPSMGHVPSRTTNLNHLILFFHSVSPCLYRLTQQWRGLLFFKALTHFFLSFSPHPPHDICQKYTRNFVWNLLDHVLLLLRSLDHPLTDSRVPCQSHDYTPV